MPNGTVEVSASKISQKTKETSPGMIKLILLQSPGSNTSLC